MEGTGREGALHRDVTRAPFNVPNDGSPASAALQRALDGAEALYFPGGTYLLDAPVFVPNSRTTALRGAGFNLSSFVIPPHSAGFVYLRELEAKSTILQMENLRFAGRDSARTSIGVVFHGRPNRDNSWLRMRDCALHGLLAGVWLQDAGQSHFHGVWAQGNVIAWRLGRSANVLYFTNVMCLNNGRFLHLDDELADGHTHGLTITNSHSILGFGSDLKLVGGQAIFITGCAFDLGQGGAEAVLIRRCQDVRISDSWICAGREGRDGIVLRDTTRWSITGTTINNCAVGLRVAGPAEYPTAGAVSSCQFAANRSSDVVFETDVTGAIVQGNQFVQDPSTSFPTAVDRRREIVVEGAGCAHNIVAHNVFSGEEYRILSDQRSIAGPNVWGMPGLLVKLDFAAMEDHADRRPESLVDPDDAGVQEAMRRIASAWSR